MARTFPSCARRVGRGRLTAVFESTFNFAFGFLVADP
jgi:hypothetical protein